jgi:hypothetical protein
MEHLEPKNVGIPDGVGAVPAQPGGQPLIASSLEIHIEELVLHGFSAGDRFRVGDALERELARLLARRGLPASAVRSASIERLDAGAFPVAPGAGARTIGTQVAQKVYQQLAPSRNEPARRARSKPERSGP